MIKNGVNDGTGVFPMHTLREGRQYIILFYGSGNQDCSNVYGGIFDSYELAVEYLSQVGYNDIRYDDEDQILIWNDDPDMHAYARIKQFSKNRGCLAGGFINGKMTNFVPYFY
jgi:hypothetical protein